MRDMNLYKVQLHLHCPPYDVSHAKFLLQHALGSRMTLRKMELVFATLMLYGGHFTGNITTK